MGVVQEPVDGRGGEGLGLSSSNLALGVDSVRPSYGQDCFSRSLVHFDVLGCVDNLLQGISPIDDGSVALPCLDELLDEGKSVFVCPGNG